ncbi:MAG: DUF1131 family protein [Parvibaculum sp.]|uniref:DUF1131 family protein n=1 Tax=Parvibaculum sp. TaxID=2024848 RepID=UPI002AB852F0|nr:DUF1131 family protein [Parvibaculum sp.]MDZ4380692.1 DUF1131 family protein [Parvibaculum sp.]
MKLKFFLAAVLVLAACDQPLDLTVTEKGVGPLTAETPNEPEAIAALLPGWDVTTTFAPIEGEDYSFIVAMRDTEIEIQIAAANREARSVSRITVFTPDIPDTNGVAVGESYSEIYTEDATPDCLPGIEERSGNIFCPALATGHIFYEFGGTWDGPDGIVPPADVIADWKVIAIHWRAGPV